MHIILNRWSAPSRLPKSQCVYCGMEVCKNKLLVPYGMATVTTTASTWRAHYESPMWCPARPGQSYRPPRGIYNICSWHAHFRPVLRLRVTNRGVESYYWNRVHMMWSDKIRCGVKILKTHSLSSATARPLRLLPLPVLPTLCLLLQPNHSDSLCFQYWHTEP